jgi:hypothetical protein
MRVLRSILAAFLPSAVALCLALGSFAVPALCAFGAAHGSAEAGGHAGHGANAAPAAGASHHGPHGAAGGAHAAHEQSGPQQGSAAAQAPAPLQPCCCDVELAPAAGLLSSASKLGRCALPGPALRAAQWHCKPFAPPALLRERAQQRPDLPGTAYARSHAPLLI